MQPILFFVAVKEHRQMRKTIFPIRGESMQSQSSVELVGQSNKNLIQPRLMAISIATLTCLLGAVLIAYLLWLFFANAPAPISYERPPAMPVLAPTPPSIASPTPAPKIAPAGELSVSGGVVILGGNDQERPEHKVTVGRFAIAETEVTNAQYLEFIKETERKAPPHWQDRTYLPGTANEPVTMVTWQDAVDYCAWLSRQIGATVRLPTEAEWELAAGGKNKFRYPWGNDWNDGAAACAEKAVMIRAVKSYPQGRSPVGSYDMAGNVWEWVADEVIDENENPVMKDGLPLRIAKGGAANEPPRFIGVRAYATLPSDKPRQYLGFRYVVVRKDENSGAARNE